MAKIFYFSGTGNCYSVARKLAAGLDATIENIADYLASPHEVEEDVLGFVVPVYCLDLPPVVAEFFRSILVTNKPYIFCVVTMSSMAGRALGHARELLAERGVKLASGFALTMPGNSIAISSGREQIKKLLDSEQYRVEEILGKVKYAYNNSGELGNSCFWSPVNSIGWFGMKNVFGVNNRKVDGSKCTGCGSCASVCPASAIKIKDGRPVFSGECFYCFACVHWCPESALSLGRLRPTVATRYVHPGVTLQEFAGQIILEGMEKDDRVQQG